MGRTQQGENGLGLSPHIQHMRPHHRSMARAVALGNRRPTDLSEIYCLSVGQVSRIMGSPAFQAEVLRLEQELDLVSHDLAKDIRYMTETALQVLDEDLNTKPMNMEMRRLRSTTALEVLGIAGIRKTGGNTTLIKIDNNIETKHVEDLEESELRDEIIELSKEPTGAYS